MFRFLRIFPLISNDQKIRYKLHLLLLGPPNESTSAAVTKNYMPIENVQKEGITNISFSIDKFSYVIREQK